MLLATRGPSWASTPGWFSGKIRGTTFAWEGLVLAEAIGPMPGSDFAELSPEENRRCVQKLGELLADFFDDRRRRSVTGILHDYAKWLLRKKWYDGPLRRK